MICFKIFKFGRSSHIFGKKTDWKIFFDSFFEQIFGHAYFIGRFFDRDFESYLTAFLVDFYDRFFERVFWTDFVADQRNRCLFNIKKYFVILSVIPIIRRGFQMNFMVLHLRVLIYYISANRVLLKKIYQKFVRFLPL